MYIIKYEFKNNIPIFKCSYCGQCANVLESTTFLSVKNRGCCWYFPKYTLMDIKNILNLNRKDFIYLLLNKKNSILKQYSIEIQGIFDESSFKNYTRTNEKIPFDTTLFFKLCSFFDKNGCSLDFSLRPHPCNLYLCRKVIELCNNKSYSLYTSERKDYYAYCYYYNEILKYMLIKNKTNFLIDVEKTLFLIETANIPTFESRTLNPLYFSNIPLKVSSMVLH